MTDTEHELRPYAPEAFPGSGSAGSRPPQARRRWARGTPPPTPSDIARDGADGPATDPLRGGDRADEGSRALDTVPPTCLGELADLFSEQLRQFSSETLRLADVFARSHGLTSAEIQALLTIRVAENHDQTTTPGDLSESLLMTSGAITGLIDRLVRSGHVRREPDRYDRRRIRLYTTRSGEEIADALLVMSGTRTRCVVSSFTVPELDTVHRFLSEVVSTNAALLLSLRSTTAAGSRSRPRPGQQPDPVEADTEPGSRRSAG